LPAEPVIILSELPPPAPDVPATGLAVRHARMAKALSARGTPVTFAWPAPGGSARISRNPAGSFDCLPLQSVEVLADWLARNEKSVVILGYWELAEYLPPRMTQPLVLDYVAPRVLERQFEDRERLGEEAGKLVELLSRCDEVWTGNSRQRDLMLPWMLLAGHDCRYNVPVRVVPISGTVAGTTARTIEASATDAGSSRDAGVSDHQSALMLFHGGRDWPWRDSRAWLDVLPGDGPWRLVDASESAGLAGHAQYLQRLGACDLALELSDDNTERRYSQSFRMIDALCAGVPVICNDFLPLAQLVERYQCGWTIGRPEELPPLLASIFEDRAELARRGENARWLAASRFNADEVYGSLVEQLEALAERNGGGVRRPLLGVPPPESAGTRLGMVAAFRQYMSMWVYDRIRRPWQHRLSRRMVDRPKPNVERACWVVLSRADVFPTDHGAAVKIERTAWGLSFHVAEVILLTDRRDGYWIYRRGEREYQSFPLWPRLAGWPRAVSMIRVMARGVPFSNAFLYLPWVDRGMQFRLMWLMRRHPVEVVQAEFPAYARPAVWASRLFGTRSLMVEHNIEFQRIADQVPELGEPARRRLKRLEVDLANACDRVITVSNRDRRDLVSAGVRDALVHVVPHGVDLERFENARPVDLREAYGIPAEHAVIVYHGIYSYPPNLEAVEELAHGLLPRLRRAGHPASVVAFGPQPPEKNLPGVVFAGAVDDLAGHLKGGDIAVIPLRQGGGTRMKILDDFAARVPVVTTHKGMEGIDVEHGKHLLIVDAPEAMAEVVAGLLEDPQARRELAEAAAQWVSRFDWREIARAYVELVRGAT